MCTTEFINDEFLVITCEGVGFVYELLQILSATSASQLVTMQLL